MEHRGLLNRRELIVTAAVPVVGAAVVLADVERERRLADINMGSRRALFDRFFGSAEAQDGGTPSRAPGPVDPKPEAPKDAATGKKEGAEEEGDPKFPPVLSWKVKVTVGKKERVINLTRTEDGKRVNVEFDGLDKAENTYFELPERMPVDTSQKEKDKLIELIAQALCKFYGKGSPDIQRGTALALKNGKIPMTPEPKTVDWEVVAKKKHTVPPHHIMSVRLIDDGDTTIVISSDEEGGYVTRVKERLPKGLDLSNKGHRIILDRIFYGGWALVGADGKDTFEERVSLGEAGDVSEFRPYYEVTRHSPKEVSTKAPDIKKP